MSRLSVPQIYNVARAAGFKPARAVVATMIALAESSGGDPTAHCLNCFPGIKEDSRGLWQINVDAHPQYAAWNLYDPATNARAAFAVSSGGKNFTPWSTYTSGSYLSHAGDVYKGLGISTGGQAPDQAPGGLPAAGSSSSGAGVQQAGFNLFNPFSWFGSIGSGIGKDVARVTLTTVFTVSGLGLVVIGLYKGVSPTVQRVQQQVTDAAGKAASVAKAAAV